MMDVEPVGGGVALSSGSVQSDLCLEDLADEYFSSVSSIARNFIREKEAKKREYHKNWKNLSQEEKDSALNEWFLDDGIRLRYEIRAQGSRQPAMLQEESIFEKYPKLKAQYGDKMVQYSESDHSDECQQNLGLFSDDQPPSRSDTSDLDCSRESTSNDLDSSELFTRLKDKASRLDNDEVNIHVNPSFNLKSKPAGLATTQLEARLASRQETSTVITQPKPAPKPNVVQRKPSSSKPDSPSVVKPSQPPPSAPGGSMKFALTSNRTSSQSSIGSRSSVSSTSSSSRPSQPPPSKPPAVVQKPTQPAPPAPTPSRRPADNPPLPPAVKSKPSPVLVKKDSTRSVELRSSLTRSSSGAKGDGKPVSNQPVSSQPEPKSSVLDDIDFKLDLDSTPPATEGDKPSGDSSPAEQKADAHDNAAFDFLLQW